MSELYPPPPPPPPPPPQRPQTSGYDFLRPFAFVFDDPRWLQKVLIGGLFMLASIFVVGIFFTMGYVARLVRNVIAGEQYPLPEWDDLGEYFSEGLKLFAVCLIWFIPVIIFAVLLGLPAIIMSAAENEGLRNVGGGMLGCAWCLIFPISFAITFFLPAALLMVVTSRRFGAAFEFSNIWTFIRANIGNYLLAIVVYLVARFIAGFGIALLCVGVLFTEFWGMVVTGFAFAQVWRLAKKTP